MVNSKIEAGKRLKEQLDLLGVSQREIATVLGCNESFISRMVNNKVIITYKTLHKIKKHLPNFDIEYVTGETLNCKVSENPDKLVSELKRELDRKNKMIDFLLKGGNVEFDININEDKPVQQLPFEKGAKKKK